tara:strand:- start:189 stop:818 length:630 start_codon:yes stop_codon:yes gene_type:complete
MALKLLNPGLRPLGMFDLNDDDAGSVVGGEYVELAADNFAVEAYAADVGQLADSTGMVSFTLKTRAAGALGGLADEGRDEYGTLFGNLIGSNAGRATSQSGAVVIGPSTDRASGKVTVFAQAGLYGVTDQHSDLDSANANDAISATANGLLAITGSNGVGHDLGIYVGAMTDTSLVSTTNAAAGLDAETEYHAVFYAGNGLPTVFGAAA